MEKFKIRDIVLGVVFVAAVIVAIYSGWNKLNNYYVFSLIILFVSTFIYLLLQSKSGFYKNSEKWIYDHLYWSWEYGKSHSYKFLSEFASILTLIYLFLAVLFFLFVFFILLWILVKGDPVVFIDSASNIMAITIVPIFIVQTWIFYHQYRYMKEPEKERIPPVWVSARDNSDETNSIFLNNGGDVPVFNMKHVTSEVSVEDRLLFPRIGFEGLNRDHLQRVDAKSKKVIIDDFRL
ncbi:MAG: hypothetical protein SYNGOMJ08_00819 [Candidatus Syntrophoarchaeum sp. GoM_oil]|nr:MAG: hypothetical protein SYNGOMJ08_00819 [Candidatus Syntrophoarchaeum sp. GoM_oil]